MATKPRRIKWADWEAYAPVREQETEWGRPTQETAEKVWVLVGSDEALAEIVAPYTFADPKYLENVAKRAVAVVLDTFVRAGRQHTRVSRAQVLDALALRWSRTFWAVRNQSGARGVRFMRRETPGLVHRDLLWAGIQFQKLWSFATQCTALYEARKLTFSSYEPRIQSADAKTLAFERVILADTAYRGYEGAARVLTADDPDPPMTVRQKVIAEVPYNVAETGHGSARIFALMNAVRLQVDVSEIRRDYEIANREAESIKEKLWIEHRVDPTQKSQITQWVEGRGLRRWTSGRDRQIDSKRTEEQDAIWADVQNYDRASALHALLHPIILQLQGQQQNAAILIKTGTQRAVNRRWHPTTFWPVGVSGKRTIWDEPEAPSMRARWFRDRYGVDFVGMDISSSVTQIVAILTGARRLERLTSEPGFNRRLTNLAWNLHKRQPIFQPGYDPDGPQLRESVKNLWMTTNYGSTAWKVVRTQREKPLTYGPGFIGPAEAARLLKRLPGSRDMAKFKKMCRTVAKVALSRNAAAGVLFIDPLDGFLFRWNTTAHRDEAIHCAGGRIMIQTPGQWVKWVAGHLWKRGQVFNKTKVWVSASTTDDAGRYPLDESKLKRQIAPMLVHSLDALFSGLVIEQLGKSGVRDFFAAHDAWYVPRTVEGRLGLGVLREAIENASKAWYRSLWSVYDRLDVYLAGDATFGPYVRRMREIWEARVAAQDWPTFAASPVAGLIVHDVEEESSSHTPFNAPRIEGDS